MDIYWERERYDGEIERSGPYQLISTYYYYNERTSSETRFVVLDITQGNFFHIPINEAVYLTPLAEAMSEDI